MLDVEQRSGELLRGTLTQHQAHAAGLKRLSARASAGPSTPPGTRRVFFSFSAYARSVIEHLKKRDVPIAEGLSDEEFERIEATFGFTFPPDLKGILQEGLPVGTGFPNWRNGNLEQLRMRVNLPILGILHEVANSKFWWKPWGTRPLEIDQAVKTARSALRRFPILVPMYGHCYIPSSPNLAGNPVFFVYQKNVVYCGYDVADFFEREAFLAHDCDPPLDFNNWSEDLGSGRSVTSIGSGDHRRGEPYQTDVDSVHRSSHSSSATDLSEASGSGNSDGQGETWGRNLDVLAKNAEFLGSPRKKGKPPSRLGRSTSGSSSQHLKSSRELDGKSHEFDSPRPSDCQDDILRYKQIIEKPLPTKTLMNLSMVMPPWAARTPRRIEFWSDLAEKQQKQCGVATGEAGLFSPRKADDDVTQEAAASPVKKHLDVKERSLGKSSKWLTGYLEEMSLVLREGGWREDDISDMMDSKSPPELWNQQLDAQVRHSILYVGLPLLVVAY